MFRGHGEVWKGEWHLTEVSLTALWGIGASMDQLGLMWHLEQSGDGNEKGTDLRGTLFFGGEGCGN